MLNFVPPAELLLWIAVFGRVRRVVQVGEGMVFVAFDLGPNAVVTAVVHVSHRHLCVRAVSIAAVWLT